MAKVRASVMRVDKGPCKGVHAYIEIPMGPKQWVAAALTQEETSQLVEDLTQILAEMIVLPDEPIL